MQIKPPIYYLPQTVANQSIVAYVIALLLCTMFFFNSSLPWWILLLGIGSILLFFLGSYKMGKRYAFVPTHTFEKKIFITALLIRLVYVIFTFFFNDLHYGHYYESDAGDIPTYVDMAAEMVDILKSGGSVFERLRLSGFEFSDTGYILYLTLLSLITFSAGPIFLPMLLKALWGALTCVYMYRLSTRHFGEHVGRMTAIFCVLQANMIWWCGSLMKETEMLFLSAIFLNYADQWLYDKEINTKSIVIVFLSGIYLSMYRAALGTVAFLALGMAVVLSKNRMISYGKKAAMISVLVIGFLFTSGASIYSDVQGMFDEARSQEKKEARQEQRSKEETGNKLMVYATSTVLAPLIFTIPFPSMVYTTEGQEMMMMVNGGNFEKNVFSFFVIVVMFMFLFSGTWRQHVFPIAYLCGYLIALVFSEFAHSGRFHMPAIPLEMMFAAYGISLMNQKSIFKRYFRLVLVIEVVACMTWCFIKLRGRGLV